MRKILLLIPIVFAMITVNAQYTLLDGSGDPILDGGTTVVEIENETTNSELDWHLESTNSSDIQFEVLSTDQPEGAQNLYCVGIHCYGPGHVTSTESLDDNNSADIKLYYKPNGHAETTEIVYKITEVGDDNNTFTFTVHYNILTLGIDTKASLKNFVIYPNPANNTINVEYSISDQSELVIYNIVGDKIKNIDLDLFSEKIQIDSSDLPSGTYFYSLVSNNKSVQTKRFVIKH